MSESKDEGKCCNHTSEDLSEELESSFGMSIDFISTVILILFICFSVLMMYSNIKVKVLEKRMDALEKDFRYSEIIRLKLHNVSDIYLNSGGIDPKVFGPRSDKK